MSMQPFARGSEPTARHGRYCCTTAVVVATAAAAVTGTEPSTVINASPHHSVIMLSWQLEHASMSRLVMVSVTMVYELYLSVNDSVVARSVYKDNFQQSASNGGDTT